MLIPIVITPKGRAVGWDGDELWINGVPCSHSGVFYVTKVGAYKFKFDLLTRTGGGRWEVQRDYRVLVGAYPYYFEFADPYVIAGRV